MVAGVGDEEEEEEDDDSLCAETTTTTAKKKMPRTAKRRALGKCAQYVEAPG